MSRLQRGTVAEMASENHALTVQTPRPAASGAVLARATRVSTFCCTFSWSLAVHAARPREGGLLSGALRRSNYTV